VLYISLDDAKICTGLAARYAAAIVANVLRYPGSLALSQKPLGQLVTAVSELGHSMSTWPVSV
jgi:hypothetical protein